MTNRARAILRQADSRDRELLLRMALGARSRPRSRRFWATITHLGGAPVAILLALAPFAVSLVHAVGSTALIILILSHAMVQMVKRTVSRPRPSVAVDGISLAIEPDRFSFPSGHAAAAMSIAMAYALAFPALGMPIIAAGLAVGASRVMLGVHYPGDVVFGQVLTFLTGAVVIHFRP